MRIIWYGHSCFKLISDGYSLVFDPYKPGSVPGYAPLALTADRVICSHSHDDHNCTAAVKLVNSGAAPVSAETLDTFHDDAGGRKRGPDKITVISCEGLRAVHFGDLGCALTSEQEERLRGADVFMIPVGGFFTIDAKAAANICERLSPRVVIPMHFHGRGFGYPMLGGVDAFVSALRSYPAVRYGGASIVVDAHTERQLALLDFKKA